MADVVVESTQPALGAIKLAWWRERLEELDYGKVPAEPRLSAAARELLSRGVSGADLAGLEEGWATLFQPRPEFDEIGRRGERLFALGAKLLGISDAVLAAAGRLYAVQKVVARQLLAEPAPAMNLELLAGHVFPKALRPLTALAALAARDAKRGEKREPEATPGRALTLFRHRLTGRIRP
jgi:phytoene synthase